MKRKKPATRTPSPKVAPTKTPDITQDEVTAICRLIDHAKAKGVRVFTGPGGLHFIFDQRTQTIAKAPAVIGDDLIP